ncbi:MAG: hypothetical protein QM731_05115 [Chitinophagaceae bacterium]
MKRIQVGFAAIIAILAMSFTFGTKSTSNIQKYFVEAGCYKSVQLNVNGNSVVITEGDLTFISDPNLVSNSTSPSIIKIVFPGDPSESTIADTPLLTATVTDASDPVTNYQTSGCPSPYHKFCCFEVGLDETSTLVVKTIRFKNL